MRRENIQYQDNGVEVAVVEWICFGQKNSAIRLLGRDPQQQQQQQQQHHHHQQQQQQEEEEEEESQSPTLYQTVDKPLTGLCRTQMHTVTM